MRLRVEVPASTSNLGPGFDCLGLALELCCRVACGPGPQGGEVRVSGLDAERIPIGPENLVLQAMAAVAERSGRSLPAFGLEIDNEIPVEAGLGSSAAARVAGVLLGDALLGRVLRREEALDLAASLEGHPTNAAPALLGGLTVAVLSAGRVVAVELDPPSGLVAVAVTPARRVATSLARTILPASVPLAIAVESLGRSALMVGALAAGKLDLLAAASRDVLHQDLRASLVPGLAAALAAGREAGALATVVSGAGSSALALCEQGCGRAEAVGQAMAMAFAQVGEAAAVRVLGLRGHGAIIEELP
jgi:homoserine kinase